MQSPILRLASILTIAAVVASIGASVGAAEPRTKVFVNDVPVPVTFNDGDSFRVLSGTYTGAKARLAGFNTLESHGPVHQWGTWTVKELYVLAKMATLHARNGVWHCETDGKLDTYGRALMWCPDLALEMVQLGFAHVMTIDDEPGRPELVAAQKEAQDARRGMWAHGVPGLIVTSTHSAEEDVDGRGTYNRIVSSEDGHSVRWKHQERYRECQSVCQLEYDVPPEKVDEAALALAGDTAAQPLLAGLAESDIRDVVEFYAKYRRVDRNVPKDRREALANHLAGYVAAGRFGAAPPSPTSCVVHVPFQRRYGGNRASCLQ